MKAFLPQVAWQTLERASFGLIYGAVMVLSIIMALESHPTASFKPAIILFGSVLAMTLARSFALLFAHGLETGARIMTLAAFRNAWRGGSAILTPAYLPTALFIAFGCGGLNLQAAFQLAQLYCVLILAILGARAGWIIRGGFWYSLLGAVSAGGLGILLAVMKYVVN